MGDYIDKPTNDTLAVVSTQFLPTIAWLSLAEKTENISIEAYEYFEKQTYRNRATLLSSQGLINIIVPINKQEKKTFVKDTTISYKENWDIQAWRTIFSCYGKSPYFIYYADKLKGIILSKQKYLLELNFMLLEFIKTSMKLSFNYYLTSRYIENKPKIYKDLSSPKQRENFCRDLGKYSQCFDEKFSFERNLCSLDLLMNLGPQSSSYL